MRTDGAKKEKCMRAFWKIKPQIEPLEKWESNCWIQVTSPSEEDADYLINSALLKTHNGPGVTLTAKNWYGATDINLMWRKNAHNGISPDKRRGKPSYKTMVDWIGHKDLGQKCLLFLIDGTYGSRDVNGAPAPKWKKAPFNNQWCCSIIASQDPLACDVVGMDLLIHEWPEFGSFNYCDEYLREAATIPNPVTGVN